ncbi:uncharacterized protein BDZ83DRAFT_359822 [Colletotrichum acutatum]|uniref:Uncharacterized protein n=1 Tax=Glomerella acutata TaxID=27357 RepID=A0AAD8ULU5_GLOAC|nr:uncharacterized protein BDZ83DRAFT_359822 [Colletotrichum acutatum]KAK1724159.1 hypothetical protein BDZ83DRAFT_359822 [Colletotrichum acutatum]
MASCPCFARTVYHGMTTVRTQLPTIATPFAPALLGGPWRFLSYDATTLDQLRRGMTEAGPRHSRPQKIPIDPIIPHCRQLTTHGPEARSPQPEDTGSLLAQPNHPSHTDQNEGTRDITSHTWRGCVDDPNAMLIPSVGFPHLCCLSPITPRPAPISAHEASEIESSLPAASRRAQVSNSCHSCSPSATSNGLTRSQSFRWSRQALGSSRPRKMVWTGPSDVGGSTQSAIPPPFEPLGSFVPRSLRPETLLVLPRMSLATKLFRQAVAVLPGIVETTDRVRV